MKIWSAKFTVTGPDNFGDDFCDAIQAIIEEHPEYKVEYITDCHEEDSN